jgi:hypothetical protein
VPSVHIDGAGGHGRRDRRAGRHPAARGWHVDGVRARLADRGARLRLHDVQLDRAGHTRRQPDGSTAHRRRPRWGRSPPSRPPGRARPPANGTSAPCRTATPRASSV